MEKVCKKPKQFECWNPDKQAEWYPIREHGAYNTIGEWLRTVFQGRDYSNGADHYNNPKKEDAAWTNNCDVVARIGEHVFYKAR
jgi:hypothetical protein